MYGLKSVPFTLRFELFTLKPTPHEHCAKRRSGYPQPHHNFQFAVGFT
jgi:hypothetical protein